MILEAHLAKQRLWSLKTFGPGYSSQRVLDHMKKEIAEVESAAPSEALGEWVDLILLAFDGAWRSGAGVFEICAAIQEKQRINESRQWPDWRTADEDKAIEHVKEHGNG